MTNPLDTRTLKVDAVAPEADLLAQAAAVIQAGGLVAFPTETVYGLGANALDPAAVRRIFAAKGRPASDPLIVHLEHADQLGTVARTVPPLAEKLAAHFWPGPLTLVLPRLEIVPPEVTAGGDSVAVRVPNHPVALGLLRAAGVPIAAPSANRFSRPSPTSAAHVLADLSGRLELVLDGGSTSVGVESTVLDLTGSVPVILRPGGVTLEALRELLPEVQHRARYLGENEDAASPGQLLRHYAPNAPMTLYAPPAEAARTAMCATVEELLTDGKRVGVLAFDTDAAAFAPLGVHFVSMGAEADLDGVAHGLFEALRAVDHGGAVDVILARGPVQTGMGLAVWDRLVRAAEGRIVAP